MSVKALLRNPVDREPCIHWHNLDIPLECKDGKIVNIDSFWCELWDKTLCPPLPEFEKGEQEEFNAGVLRAKEFLLNHLQDVLNELPKGRMIEVFFQCLYNEEHNMWRTYISDNDIVLAFHSKGSLDFFYKLVHSVSKWAFKKEHQVALQK